MPIKPAPDPNNPGGWIWVDSVTGAPATQPGGPGTPYVAPSDTAPTPTPTGGAPARPPGTVPYSELASSLNQAGWTPVAGSLQKEAPRVIANPATGAGIDPSIPATIEQPTGRWQVVFSTGEGKPNRLVYLTPAAGQNPAESGADPTDERFGWQISSAPTDVPERTSPAEENARVAQAEAQANQAKSNASIAAANLAKTQADTAEREKNAASGKGYITNEEVQKNQQDGIANNLTQQQIDARKEEIANNNRNTAVSNQIAALNANTSAANALSQATASAARTKFEEGQLGLDQAKFEHTKSQDEITQRNAAAKIQLDQLQQQQANEIAQGTLGMRGQELAQRTASDAAQLAQRQAEQAQAQQTAQMQATSQGATGALSAIGQGAQTGAGMLQARAAQAQQMMGNVLGLLGQGQSAGGPTGTRLPGGIMSPIPGFGENLVQGIGGWLTELGGGPDVYKSAANLVQRADPSTIQGGDAAHSFAALSQMMQKYRDLTGTAHPVEGVANGTTGLTTPVTQPNLYNPQASTAGMNAAGFQDTPQGRAAAQAQNPALLATPQPVPQPYYPSPNPAMSSPGQVAGQNYGASTAYTGGVSPWNAVPQPAFVTPYTTPAPPKVTVSVG